MQFRTRASRANDPGQPGIQRGSDPVSIHESRRSAAQNTTIVQSVWASVANVATECHGLASSIAEIDPRSSARLQDLAAALTSETGRQRWSDVDLRRAFHTERLAHDYAVRREGGYAPQRVEIADRVRNVLVLVPILLTWAALAEAARAYERFITANPALSDTPFLLAWERGFDGAAGPLGLTFSTVALIDAVVIIVMILLTFYTHGRREAQEDVIADTASRFQAEFDNVLAEATVILAGDRVNRPAILADSVERLADRFDRGSQELLTQLQLEHDRMERLAGRRERETADFGKFAIGMRAGAEELHRLLVDLRQIASGLESTIGDLASDVGATTTQNASLLTAVSNLERLTSSSIQSDQAASRQIAQAAGLLSETADKAIAGANQAAQAGRIASDAVRGLGQIAQAIAESQARIDRLVVGDLTATNRLSDALIGSTTGAENNARALNDVSAALSHLQQEFDRIGAQTGHQADALATVLSQQATIARDISQVTRELGAVGLNTSQRQREVTQEVQHLIQRLDNITTTLNRVAQQTPSVDALQEAFASAMRSELRADPTSSAADAPARRGQWSRS